VSRSPICALALTGTFVILSQLKINVTNAYAGSIAWSNFFSRLTTAIPAAWCGWCFNVLVALLLMEIGVYQALEQTLALLFPRRHRLGRRAGGDLVVTGRSLRTAIDSSWHSTLDSMRGRSRAAC